MNNNTSVYLSQTLFHQFDKQTIMLASLLYDTIYVDIDIKTVLGYKRDYLREQKEKGLIFPLSSADISFRLAFSDSFLDETFVFDLSKTDRAAVEYTFQYIKNKCQPSLTNDELGAKKTIYIIEIISNKVIEYYELLNPDLSKTGFDWHGPEGFKYAVAVLELWYGHKYKDVLSSDCIFTPFDMEIQNVIAARGDIPFSSNEFTDIVYQWALFRGENKDTARQISLARSDFEDSFGLDSMHDLLMGVKPLIKYTALNEILGVSVPDFSSIPLLELIKAKTKERFLGLRSFINHASSKSTNEFDVLKYYCEHLYKLANVLSPNTKDIAVGVIGNLPLPFIPINPIGLMQLSQDIKKHYNIKQDYGWLFDISRLSQMIKG